MTVTEPLDAKKPRRSNMEKYLWLYMRVSGVLLLVLIFGHLIANLVVGDGIKAIDFGFVGGKLANPFWQWWDVSMLWLALIHGSNGMRNVINDYVHRRAVRAALTGVLHLVTLALIVLGTLVVFTFDPCPAGAAANLLPSFCPVG